jgi:hypothetical protein
MPILLLLLPERTPAVTEHDDHARVSVKSEAKLVVRLNADATLDEIVAGSAAFHLE